MPSFANFQEHAKTKKSVFAYAFGFTLLGWLFRGAEWFFIANAVGIPLGLFYSVLLHPLVTLFAFVPVSIAGLGLVEFAGMTIIGNMGLLPVEKAGEMVFAFLILDRGMNLLVDLLGLKRLVRIK